MGCIVQRNKSLKDGGEQYNNNKDLTNVMSNKKKIVLAGLPGSGKTSILQRMKHNTFINAANPTSQSSISGLQIEQIAVRDDLDFLLYDIDGTNIKIQNQHLIEADAIVFVIDSCDRKNMWKVKEELSRISQEMKYSESAVLVLFNKQDNEETIQINTLLQETGVHSELDLDVFIQKCSAKTGEGLKEGFDKLIHYFLSEERRVF